MRQSRVKGVDSTMLTRRRLLKLGLAGIGASMVPLLSACQQESGAPSGGAAT